MFFFLVTSNFNLLLVGWFVGITSLNPTIFFLLNEPYTTRKKEYTDGHSEAAEQ
jgi:hypothetical protein